MKLIMEEKEDDFYNMFFKPEESQNSYMFS